MLCGSAIFGGLGGWASAKSNGQESIDDRINHVISMAVFGCSVSMVGFWWFENDAGVGGLMVGVSGICGLIGNSIFEPVKALVEKLIGAISPDWIFKAVRKLASEDKDEKPDV